VLAAYGDVARIRSAKVAVVAVGQRDDAVTTDALVAVTLVVGWAGLEVERAG